MLKISDNTINKPQSRTTGLIAYTTGVSEIEPVPAANFLHQTDVAEVKQKG